MRSANNLLPCCLWTTTIPARFSTSGSLQSRRVRGFRRVSSGLAKSILHAQVERAVWRRNRGLRAEEGVVEVVSHHHRAGACCSVGKREAVRVHKRIACMTRGNIRHRLSAHCGRGLKCRNTNTMRIIRERSNALCHRGGDSVGKEYRSDGKQKHGATKPSIRYNHLPFQYQRSLVSVSAILSQIPVHSSHHL